MTTHDASAAPVQQDISAPHHGDEPSMVEDCGGLLAACVALLLTVAGLLRWRRGRSWRVLWLRPHPTHIPSGLARAPFDQLTPLQRTTVLRC